MGAGHGDPLLREPDRVADDVATGRVTAEDARRIYGVVLADAASADDAATSRVRDTMREERIATARERPADSRGKLSGPSNRITRALEHVRLAELGGSLLLSCGHCDEVLGDAEGGYRSGCALVETTLPEIDPQMFVDPRSQLDDDLVLRHFACPGCGTFLDADICRPGDPVYNDVVIRRRSEG
jgi:N-methylhydantoinase B